MSPEPLTPYQRRLFGFLTVASFFEGYDFIALTQILPNFRAEMGMGKAGAGILLMVVNLGSVLSYFLVRSADRWGRRVVLTVTIAGYTVATFLSGLAPNPWVFAIFQLNARVFLIGEYATSMVIAAEEYPASRRGTIMGLIAAFSSLGAIVCAGTVPVLIRTPWGWRTVYFVALIPLVIVGYARRGLRETRRFEEQGHPEEARGLMEIWKTPYRRRVLELAAVWCCAYIATQNTVAFWKDFAVSERGLTDADVGRAIATAAVVAMPLVFLVGKLMDVLGRRPVAAVVFVVGAAGTWGCYTLEGQGPLTAALVLGIFASSAYLPILNALTAELFPTEHRADGFAWSNNLLGRIGYVLSPALVGFLAARIGWGPVLRSCGLFSLLAVVLVYALLPETKGRTLEETSRVVP